MSEIIIFKIVAFSYCTFKFGSLTRPMAEESSLCEVLNEVTFFRIILFEFSLKPLA
jgi:hypothetical protein